MRGELKSSEEEEEEQEAEREAGGGGEGQAEAVSGAMTWKKNVPLQKGAPKRERSGGTLRAPSSWERGGVGWGRESSRRRKDTRHRRRDRFLTKGNRMLFCPRLCSILRLSWESSRPAGRPASHRRVAPFLFSPCFMASE